MPEPTRRGQNRLPALLDAIAARRGQWDELRRAKTPPSKREKELLDLLESDGECSTAWSLLARPSNKWGSIDDHGEVLRLLVKSADIACDPQANRYAEAAVVRRYEELKSACNLLIDYNQAQIGIYDDEIDLEEPLDESKSRPFKLAYFLYWMLDDIVCDECIVVGEAIWTPGRPTAVGPNGEARMFEHVFSSLLRKAFGRPCDDFVMDMSRQIYPAATPLESSRTMKSFRQLERSRHRRRLDGFLKGIDISNAGLPASDPRVVEDE